jgi:hypothetical protein
MKKSSIRLVAMLLCVLMCMSIMPTEALAYTEPAAAVSNGGVKITSQPQDKSVAVSNSNKATFKVEASGKNLKYQWFCKKGSGSWEKIAGATKAKLTVTVKENMDGWKYRCRVSSGSTKVYSKAAELNVANASAKYRALLVGEVSFYPTCTRNKGDVQLMKSLLNKVKGPKGGRYKITCKYDLTKAGIKNAIKNTFKGAKKSDVSLFFIATHGVTNISSGDWAGAICTYDGDYIQIKELASWLKAVPGKVIVILGSCGSGAAISRNGVKSAAEDPDAFNEAVVSAFAAADEVLPSDGEDAANIGEFRKSKFYVLTAAKHQESSWGSEYYRYNFFTYYLSKGGKGAADSNKDRKITLKELYKYVSKNAKGPYYDGYGYYYQHARVYPSNSSYVLFKTP